MDLPVSQIGLRSHHHIDLPAPRRVGPDLVQAEKQCFSINLSRMLPMLDNNQARVVISPYAAFSSADSSQLTASDMRELDRYLISIPSNPNQISVSCVLVVCRETKHAYHSIHISIL